MLSCFDSSGLGSSIS